MIDREIKRCLGQMMHGIEVVSASAQGVARAYTSHWVSQVSFEEPIVMCSVSPRHDTYPLIVESGQFAVSLLAGDQVAEGQYFSYPGRRFGHIAEEYLTEVSAEHPNGPVSVVPNCIAWLRCEVLSRQNTLGEVGLDHELFFGHVTEVGHFDRLKEPVLLYSSRLGWRVSGEGAREPGISIRDQLLARLDSGSDGGSNGGEATDTPT